MKKKEKRVNEDGQIRWMVEKLQAEGVEVTCGIRVGDRETRQWPELG